MKIRRSALITLAVAVALAIGISAEAYAGSDDLQYNVSPREIMTSSAPPGTHLDTPARAYTPDARNAFNVKLEPDVPELIYERSVSLRVTLSHSF